MNTKVSEGKSSPQGYMKYVFLIILAGAIVIGFWLRGDSLVANNIGRSTAIGTEDVTASKGATDAVSQKISQQEIEKALSLVGRHIILPQNETPVVASILNSEELIKEQPFYSNTINGDILFIYFENRRAILYSPERDILVNVGPINVED